MPQVIWSRLERRQQLFYLRVTVKKKTPTVATEDSSALTYHIGVEWRGDLLGIEVIPVDGGEKHVIFDFNLQKHESGTVKRRPGTPTRLQMCPLSKHLQSPLCSPAAWSCPSAAGPPADASPRWKCWVSAAAACSGCCRTSPPCSGCRREAEEGPKRAISNDALHRFASCVRNVCCGSAVTHQAVEHLKENSS